MLVRDQRHLGCLYAPKQENGICWQQSYAMLECGARPMLRKECCCQSGSSIWCWEFIITVPCAQFIVHTRSLMFVSRVTWVNSQHAPKKTCSDLNKRWRSSALLLLQRWKAGMVLDDTWPLGIRCMDTFKAAWRTFWGRERLTGWRGWGCDRFFCSAAWRLNMYNSRVKFSVQSSLDVTDPSCWSSK